MITFGAEIHAQPPATTDTATSPSLEDTVKWITTTLQNRGGWSWKRTIDKTDLEAHWRYRSVEFANGVLSFQRELAAIGSGPIRDLDQIDTVKFRLALRNLDPTSVSTITGSFTTFPGIGTVGTINTHEVSVESTGNEKTISMRQTAAISPKVKVGEETKVIKVTFIFSERPMADRFAKALRHAIKLSGGETDVF